MRGAINCVYPFTLSTALACVRSIVDLSIPNNAGYFRPIEVIAPEGTIVNPRPPAAVAARGITGIRIADTIFGALAQAVPRPAARLRVECAGRRHLVRRHRRQTAKRTSISSSCSRRGAAVRIATAWTRAPARSSTIRTRRPR